MTRGNHDRAHAGDPWANVPGRASGRATTASTTSSSPATSPATSRRELNGLRVIGLDTYDKPGNGSDPGALSADQFAWFRSELAQNREQPTIVFGHHPLVVQNSPFPISPSNTLDAAQAATILQDYAADARRVPAPRRVTPTATSARSARSRRT